jgi:hypothetical protein
MRYLSTVIGGAVCGALCFGIWPEMWKSYGIMGGWLTAAIVISICWYMNHWLGLFWNQSGQIWVDQGWSVASAGVSWGLVRFNSHFAQALPVVGCCLVGGALAGYAAAYVKRNNPAFACPSKPTVPEAGPHV